MAPHNTFDWLCPDCGSPEVGDLGGKYRECLKCGFLGTEDELVTAADLAADAGDVLFHERVDMGRTS